jgi:hypothetical protein
MFYIHILAEHGNSLDNVVSLRICLATLATHETLYSAARRARRVLENIMAHLGVQLESSLSITECNTPPGADTNMKTYPNAHQPRIERVDRTGTELVDIITPVITELPVQNPDILEFDPSDMHTWQRLESVGESWLNFSESPLVFDLSNGGCSEEPNI